MKITANELMELMEAKDSAIRDLKCNAEDMYKKLKNVVLRPDSEYSKQVISQIKFNDNREQSELFGNRTAGGIKNYIQEDK